MSILSNGHQWKLTEFVDNNKYSFDRDQILNSLTSKDIDDAFNSISKWEGYSPTPLVKLNKLTKELNLKNIFYKDENKRFNLKSFKALTGPLEPCKGLTGLSEDFYGPYKALKLVRPSRGL